MIAAVAVEGIESFLTAYRKCPALYSAMVQLWAVVANERTLRTDSTSGAVPITASKRKLERYSPRWTLNPDRRNCLTTWSSNLPEVTSRPPLLLGATYARYNAAAVTSRSGTAVGAGSVRYKE